MEFDKSVRMRPWVAKLKENLPTVMKFSFMLLVKLTKLGNGI